MAAAAAAAPAASGSHLVQLAARVQHNDHARHQKHGATIVACSSGCDKVMVHDVSYETTQQNGSSEAMQVVD
jgi:hypothetical protein